MVATGPLGHQAVQHQQPGTRGERRSQPGEDGTGLLVGEPVHDVAHQVGVAAGRHVVVEAAVDHLHPVGDPGRAEHRGRVGGGGRQVVEHPTQVRMRAQDAGQQLPGPAADVGDPLVPAEVVRGQDLRHVEPAQFPHRAVEVLPLVGVLGEVVPEEAAVLPGERRASLGDRGGQVGPDPLVPAGADLDQRVPDRARMVAAQRFGERVQREGAGPGPAEDAVGGQRPQHPEQAVLVGVGHGGERRHIPGTVGELVGHAQPGHRAERVRTPEAGRGVEQARGGRRETARRATQGGTDRADRVDQHHRGS